MEASTHCRQEGGQADRLGAHIGHWHDAVVHAKKNFAVVTASKSRTIARGVDTLASSMSTAVTPRLWWFSHYFIDYLYANPGCELWKRHSVSLNLMNKRSV